MFVLLDKHTLKYDKSYILYDHVRDVCIALFSKYPALAFYMNIHTELTHVGLWDYSSKHFTKIYLYFKFVLHLVGLHHDITYLFNLWGVLFMDK